MRHDGLKGVLRDKHPRTTQPATETDRPADLVDRVFAATAPDQLWVADITYIGTFAGFAYAAFVLDVFSRRVAGWHLSTSLHTDLVLDALNTGIWQRSRAGHDLNALIHHRLRRPVPRDPLHPPSRRGRRCRVGRVEG